MTRFMNVCGAFWEYNEDDEESTMMALQQL